jgi:hypothetical protein
VTDLELALADLGRHVAWAEAELVAGVDRRLAEAASPRWSRRKVAAVVAVVAVAIGSAVTPVRTAVADLLGFGFVDVVTVERLPGAVAAKADLGQPVSVDEAAGRLDFIPRLPADLGPPDESYLAPAGGLTMVWREAGILVTEHPGHLVDVSKFVERGTAAQPTMVEGHPALWVDEGHAVVFVDDGGQRTEGTPRLAGATLAWEEDGLIIRIETTGNRDDAHRVAEQISR